MNTRTVYKVVRRVVSTGAFSSAIGHPETPRSVPYRIGYLSRPNEGQNNFLWVFNNLKNARAFRRQLTLQYYVILRGIGVRVRFIAYGNECGGSKKYRYDSREIRFKGTLFCDSFLPLSEV